MKIKKEKSMKDKKLRIIIIGFYEDLNLGDPVICESCKYIVEKIFSELNQPVETKLIGLAPPSGYTNHKITKFIRKRCGKARSNFYQLCTYIAFRIAMCFPNALKKHYSEALEGADLVLFAGGGMLKYISQDFWAFNYCIEKYCSKHNIPIAFNAVGIEGYDKNNPICKVQEKIVNSKSTKFITTRDDIDSLKLFLKSSDDNLVVGDSALYSNEIYKLSKKEDIIGLNTIRHGIFNINGFVEINQEILVNWYCEIIKRIEADGLKWQLFTNGLESDYNLAKEVLKKLEKEETTELLVPKPTTTQELLYTISKYKAVVCGRMHAAIISTSLDIPSIGLVWNEKLKWFAHHIGATERFIKVSEINNYDLAYKTLIKAMNEGNNNLNTQKLKNKTYSTLKCYFEKFIEKSHNNK